MVSFAKSSISNSASSGGGRRLKSSGSMMTWHVEHAAIPRQENGKSRANSCPLELGRWHSS